MEERKKKTLGMLLFMTAQVVSLAVLEHQQQTEARQSTAGACPSFTLQMLLPVLALWESMHSAAIVAFLKRRVMCRNFFSEDEEEKCKYGSVCSKKRKRKSVHRGRLATVLMSSSKGLQDAFAKHMGAHIESQTQNSDFDRFQRNAQSEQLVTLLGNLAKVMEIIAERL